MRFIWSMTRPHPGRDFFGPDALHPTRIDLAVREHGAVVARTTLTRLTALPSVRARTLSVRKDGLCGVYYAPAAGHRRRPAVLALGGSGGGAPFDMAAVLASHGYPALALEYFKAPGLPPTLSRIPLEYFARGLHWLGRQPAVDSRRLVIEGGSRGGEAAMLIGATFPTLVHGAIGLVPGYQTEAGFPDGGAAWTYRGKDIPADRLIRVERINGPVLTASGGEDAVWSSSVNTDQIELRLNDHHFRFPHERLDFPHAGHDIDVPYKPQADPVTFGGARRATAAAQVVVWKHIIRFMDRMQSL
jgi:dienelactone hydrolase